MQITLTGATGFIGRRMVKRLIEDSHTLRLLARHPPAQADDAKAEERVRWFAWDSMDGAPPPESLEGADAVVNLMGEPVAQRWSDAVKDRIRASRVAGTENLVAGLRATARPPRTLVSASAIGIYGSRGDEALSEDSTLGTDFLARVCGDWERAAREAESLGARVVTPRIGLVLGHGGALSKMLPPFRAGLGGRIASGRQWTSWIHLDDLVGLIAFALGCDSLRGPVNATAPNPVTNADFTRALSKVLHRPAVIPIPALALRLLFGEMAQVVLASQRVLPEAANAAGYRFAYPELEAALRQIL
ncbi:MAG: TIGR01777 family oxidoreductase [Pseudomonadota bacterium]